MRILCNQQRTPEWFAARKGVISASEARCALMSRGTKGRRLYVEQLADDLEGIPDFGDEETPPWFLAGAFYESYALGWYQFTYDVDVEETGFIVHDDYAWIGCSPDGLVGDDGLIEIKYRKSLRTFKEHASVTRRPAAWAQMQTQMFVTGRQWCDYVNYWRSDDDEREKGHVQRVYRDDAYIDNTLLPAFIGLWEEVQDELERRKLQKRATAL